MIDGKWFAMREDARAVGEKPADGKRGRVAYEPIKHFYSLY